MCVCMVITYNRLWINRVKLPNLLVVSRTGKMKYPYCRCIRGKCILVVVVVVVYLTLLTDPLRIQPWSQDRRNQTKSNRKSEISRESRQKRTDKNVASKGHRRDKNKIK